MRNDSDAPEIIYPKFEGPSREEPSYPPEAKDPNIPSAEGRSSRLQSDLTLD
jgi:hypothetical protein